MMKMDNLERNALVLLLREAYKQDPTMFGTIKKPNKRVLSEDAKANRIIKQMDKLIGELDWTIQNLKYLWAK